MIEIVGDAVVQDLTGNSIKFSQVEAVSEIALTGLSVEESSTTAISPASTQN